LARAYAPFIASSDLCKPAVRTKLALAGSTREVPSEIDVDKLNVKRLSKDMLSRWNPTHATHILGGREAPLRCLTPKYAIAQGHILTVLTSCLLGILACVIVVEIVVGQRARRAAASMMRVIQAAVRAAARVPPAKEPNDLDRT